MVLAALVALGLVGATLLGPARRLVGATGLLGQRWRRDGGMLAARMAALRVRIAERRA